MGTNNFVVLLPGGTVETVSRRIDRLRNLIGQAEQFFTVDGDVSLSFGAALYPTDGRDAEELLAVAGRRVYQNRAGRKRCVSDGMARRS